MCGTRFTSGRRNMLSCSERSFVLRWQPPMPFSSCEGPRVFYPQLQFIDLVFAVPAVVQRQIPMAIFCCFPEMAALIADFGSGVVMVGFADIVVRAVSLFVRPKVLCILVGVDQKDNCAASLWPRSSPTSAWSWLALLVLRFALCSLLLSTGPRCSASWPVWTRRTVMCSGLSTGFALCFLRCRQAHDVRHHGRCDQRRTVCSDTVGALGVHRWFCWSFCFLRCIPNVCRLVYYTRHRRCWGRGRARHRHRQWHVHGWF